VPDYLFLSVVLTGLVHELDAINPSQLALYAQRYFAPNRSIDSPIAVAHAILDNFTGRIETLKEWLRRLSPQAAVPTELAEVNAFISITMQRIALGGLLPSEIASITKEAIIELKQHRSALSALAARWKSEYEAESHQASHAPELPANAEPSSSKPPAKGDAGGKRTGRRGRKRKALSDGERRAVDLWAAKDQMGFRDYADLIAALKEESITFTRLQITKLLDRVRKAN
jgi:hypothetical protein